MDCKYCKTEIEEHMLICPKCGAPKPREKDYIDKWDKMMGYEPGEDYDFEDDFEDELDLEEEEYYRTLEEQKEDDRKHRLGTIALVLAVTGVFAPIGFLLAIIDKLIKNGSNKILSNLAIMTSIFIIISVIIIYYVYFK